MASRLDDPRTAALSTRLTRLEQRVRRLEAAGDRAPAADQTSVRGGARPEATERFWALEALKDLVGEPGAVLFTGAVSTPDGGRAEWQQAHPTADVLDADWSESLDRLRALAHPVRLLLLHDVLTGAHTAAELGANSQLGTTGQLYHHLRQLVAAGWLRSAGHVRYQVPAERVVPLLVTLAATRR